MTIWWALTAIGLLGFAGLSAAALVGGTRTLRAGRAVPDVEVTSPGGLSRSLSEAAGGRDEIIVVAPNCDICASELDRMVDEVRQARDAGKPDGLGRVLLLVIRNPGIPRTTFMSAYTTLIELGVEAVFMQPGLARELGIERVPGFIRLDEDGRIVSLDYAEVS